MDLDADGASLVLTAIGLWSAAKKEVADARLASSIDRIAKHYELGGKSAQELADEILDRIPAREWRLSEAERRALDSALSNFDGAKFPFHIATPPASEAAQMFAVDLSEAFSKHGWQVTTGTDFAVKAGLTGLYIVLSKELKTNDQVPPNANVLSGLLTMANLKPKPTQWNISRDRFILLVCEKPK